MRGNQVLRLGDVGFGQGVENPRFSSNAKGLGLDDTTPKSNGYKKFALGAIALLALAGGAAAFSFTSLIDDSSESSNTGELPTSSPVTRFPTAFVTPRPTSFPTQFPTVAPSTNPTTIDERTDSPTFLPTTTPTFAPVGDCLDLDEECGCNQVRSEAVDIIFMLDASGSVDEDDFQLMSRAIIDFAEENMPLGARIGYIEFADEVQSEFDLSEFETAEEVEDELEDNDETGGRTNPRAAFIAARDQLRSDSGAPRPEATLVLLMVSDGNPNPCDEDEICDCDRVACDEDDCCEEALDESGGANVLRELAEEFDLTFFFIPVNPDGNDRVVNVNLYDNAGLPPERFEVFEIGNFAEFGELLQGEELVIPLGPCVEAPTVSGGDRLLEWEASEEVRSDSLSEFFGL